MAKIIKYVSFYNNIKEFVPVSGFESAQAHGKSLYFFDSFGLDLQILLPSLVAVFDEFHFEQAFLHQVVVVVVVSHLAFAAFVFQLEHLQLLALLRVRVEHVWVEEAADLLVVILQRLQYQQRRDYEEYLAVSLFKLLSKLLVLLSSRLNNRRKMQ